MKFFKSLSTYWRAPEGRRSEIRARWRAHLQQKHLVDTRQNPTRKGWNWRVTCFYFFLAIFLAVIIFWLYQLSPVSVFERFQAVTITSGQGLNEIVELLAENNLIRSKSFFELYAIITGRAGDLKPGNYLLSASWSSIEILKRLTIGVPNDIQVTIFEGESIKDINKKLMELGILSGGDVLPPEFEGYAFPDTYRFFFDSPLTVIVKKFEDNFQQKAQPVLAAGLPTKVGIPTGVGTITHYSVLIIASMIEKEVPFLDDRAIVSGILWKRLAAGMALQVDATICYANFQTAEDCYPLAKSYFDATSRYNTYKYQGLPPGPISNPGLSAIEAALNPQDSPYWYYLSDPATKKTIFARNLDEHNLNRVKYLGL